MKVGDLVMYKYNPRVMALVVDISPGGACLDLLQVSGQEWATIRRGFNPKIAADAFIPAKDGERQAYIKKWMNSQIHDA
jgi:hypothetical protein